MPDDMKPTQRFSDRVAYYVKYRPRYPSAAIEFFVEEAGLEPPDRIADVGSGTGILSEALLERGYTVFGVEPNAEMRAAGEEILRGYDQFISVDASAEQTGLDEVSAITCGQSFHWFDLPLAQNEFRRILKPRGLVALFWNTWQHEDDPVNVAYNALLKQLGIEYEKVRHTRLVDADFDGFFASYERTVFPNPLTYDLDGLKGRALSSSYVPLPGHPNHAPLMDALDVLFAEFEQDGAVTFPYDTEVYIGRV